MPACSASAALERLRRLHPKVIDLSLDRIERLLDRLGRPEDRLPPVIHVAGTNGKGSVVAFLRAMLAAAGLRVHAYTSPHLVRFNERIVVAGREIACDALAAVLLECEAANGGAPITFFEVTTAAALLAFARTPADVTLLETGLGGRLDATNVVARPALTAITPIALDHQEFLGATLAQIAAEKAGILKPGVGVVVAAQSPEAAAVIRACAARIGTPLIEEGPAWAAEWADDGSVLYRDENKVLTLPPPGLAGEHQLRNAGVAIACARRLPGLAIHDEAIARGLRDVRWPARLQRLGGGRLAALLPEGWELWLDGGHNPAAGAALARHLQGWRDRAVILVFGMLRSKDAEGFLAPLAPHVERLLAVPVPGESPCVPPEDAAGIAARLAVPAEPRPSVEAALRTLADGAARRSGGRVLICGSLYLAGAVLAENEAQGR